MLTDSESDLQDMLEFLHGKKRAEDSIVGELSILLVARFWSKNLDGDLHQNVVETLPPQFKARVESPVLQRRSLKRVYQLVDHENKLQHMPKTVQYRDPNLRQLKVEILHKIFGNSSFNPSAPILAGN